MITVTRWMVLIGDAWRAYDADVASAVAATRPDAVRLGNVPVPASPWFDRYQRAERSGVTPHRLAMASRALQRQVEKAGLFGGHVAASQPTPLQRVEVADGRAAQIELDMRLRRAAGWRECRRRLRDLPPAMRLDVLERWNRRIYPGNPEHLLMILKKTEGRR